MPVVSIPVERLIFGNEHWRSNRAVDEIQIYCDLLDVLQGKIESLETRHKDEEVALINVQAVISSYSIEIAMKSLWALDNSPKVVLPKHDLLYFFDGLKDETVASLNQLQFTRKILEGSPKPFISNRYSMECSGRDITVYPSRFLRPLAELLRN